LVGGSQEERGAALEVFKEIALRSAHAMNSARAKGDPENPGRVSLDGFRIEDVFVLDAHLR
jgi:hypothetical protein